MAYTYAKCNSVSKKQNDLKMIIVYIILIGHKRLGGC